MKLDDVQMESEREHRGMGLAIEVGLQFERRKRDKQT